MEITTQEFFHDLKQDLMAGAEANSAFQLAEFMNVVANELTETGFIEGFEFCHYRAQRGVRVDGYWFTDDGNLDLFIADFDSRTELATLTQTNVLTIFKRLANFLEASKEKELHRGLEETSPEYGLARDIADRNSQIRQARFLLFSERTLSERLQALEDDSVAGVPISYHVWDVSRLHRQQSSRGHKEALDLDLVDMFGDGVSCLRAHFGRDAYPSYLIVIPGEILSRLYDKYGSRLLEQNVRTFLQARGKVNKGIRTTILAEPGMFFAYNNGITATAQEVETRTTDSGLQITRILDLQIVNGGQTTASLFHTARRDNASLEQVFVQMKLSVVDSEDSEQVVPRISEYANTQNRVNAADFFSNHPFHRRMEEFSRRIWAPAQQGAQRETKWFYERARGQYADAQSKLTRAGRRRFKAEYPRLQMFTKTDLAKFENVWEDHPKWVNLGAQKNFARFANRIGKEWVKSRESFNELYFRRAIARGIMFRRTERLVSSQSWYNGGYRANIVAYAIAAISEICKQRNQEVDFMSIWNTQMLNPSLIDALTASSLFANEYITQPPPGVANITEWCKKDACWQRIQAQVKQLESKLTQAFWDDLVSLEEHKEEARNAKKTQKIDDGIALQQQVFDVPVKDWTLILEQGMKKKILTPKEVGILRIAQQIPARIPSEKQSAVLIEVLEKARAEGISIANA
ncbi:MAG: AIPR family protein [Gammaproteobacteria bacterium]|nr:AIPR family protein [Gammaproteobacteria bacterium]MYD02705.1 AIPR family protein [Gammaproteobacteria bacterium]MYI25882.1 AIPR family protein [Gammaproteobacteria bacterium]